LFSGILKNRITNTEKNAKAVDVFGDELSDLSADDDANEDNEADDQVEKNDSDEENDDNDAESFGHHDDSEPRDNNKSLNVNQLESQFEELKIFIGRPLFNFKERRCRTRRRTRRGTSHAC
jgi:hypothetical protein